MIKEERKIVYDEELKIEAVSFNGVHQPFTKHFHDYYVIGIMKKGNRKFICNSKNYNIQTNNIILINPNDYHECIDIGQNSLDYEAIHISKEIMTNLANEIFKSKDMVIFNKNVISDDTLLKEIEILTNLVISNDKTLEKEELFYIVIKDRINQAKKQLQENNSILDISIQCGFSDQSHFTNLFKETIGITPKQYKKNF